MNEEKAHAKLSASGSERWLNCPASIKLSEEAPEPPSNKYAEEGTIAHGFLEKWLKKIRSIGAARPIAPPEGLKKNKDMFEAVAVGVRHVTKKWSPRNAELIIEEKISLEFIGQDMFGTADIQIVEHFGELYVPDYKHGKSPVEVEWVNENGQKVHNTQLIYYALGVAYKYGFDFKTIRIGVIQPRAEHSKGPIRTAVLTVAELRAYEFLFRRGVERVYSAKPRVFPGPWCKYCPAKEHTCPVFEKAKYEKAKGYFK